MKQTRYHLAIVRWTFWMVGLLACSSHTGEPKKPPGKTPPPDAAIVASGPSERECTDEFAHAIDIYVAELRQQKPNQLPTGEEITKLQTELRDQYLSTCRGSTLEGHRCAMAAKTLAELGVCQPTPSNSTSNSSVAPGGMTPAGPRSP
jgi:hypothetical protein